MEDWETNWIEGQKQKKKRFQAWTKIMKNSEVVVRTFRARQGRSRGWSACVSILDTGLEYMITLLLKGVNVGQSILVRDHQQFILGNQFNKPCSRKFRVSNPNIPWSSNSYTKLSIALINFRPSVVCEAHIISSRYFCCISSYFHRKV